MSETELIDYLRQRVQKAGNQELLAAELEISPQYLGDILYGRRKVSDRVLETLGMERRVEYVEKCERDMEKK